MSADANLLLALKRTLRRRYANNIAGLKLEADRIFAETTELVTITQQTFEGGSSTAAITCPRATLLLAIEDVLVELDITAARPSNAAVGYFR